MGRKVNLSHLSQEECEQILDVIQKDFELRQKEKQRLSKIETDVRKEEDKTGILAKQLEFNQNCCIRCCRTFGYIFNRKQKCIQCEFNVCKSCSHYEDKYKGYSCYQCMKERDYKLQSCEWFYCNVSQRFKRFGSAKVVRSLYKRKSGSQCKSTLFPAPSSVPNNDSDSELDSGYDPSQFSSLHQSPVKKRPPLQGLFDHSDDELPLPSSRSPVSDKPVSRATSLESILSSSNSREQRSLHFDAKRQREKDHTKGKPLKETRDIYKEAFESARKAEEFKFKTKFDLLLGDLTRALDRQSPSGITSSFGSTSYGEVMLTFRSRMKELLTGFSQRLQLAYESFDIPHQGETTSQQVRQNVSKMVEGILGESLDLTSDEAVSDLSSLSDDSGGDQNSFEDQIAQAIVSKLLENHRREVSESLDHPDGHYTGHSYGNYSDDVEEDKTSDIVKDFEELRNFVRNTQARTTPVPRDIEEQISEQPIERVTLDNREAAEDFHIRCSSADRVYNAEPPLPDFSEFDGIDFDSHEIDPDLLSMNLAIIPEETEEELEDEANEKPDKAGRENWIFKGMVSPYDNMGHRRVGSDPGKPIYMMVPEPEDDFVPRVGNKDADQLSDLSDTDHPNQSADDLSDDENTFYAKTSEELARISRKHSTTSLQTDSDADSGSASKILTGALRTDTGPILGRKDLTSGTSSKGVDSKSGPEPLKLTEEFVPAEGDDPTFILPPESVTIAEGEPLRIICRVAGTSAIDVFWYREHTQVEALEEGEDVDILNEGDKHAITLYNLTKAQAGQYMCIALSDQGKCTQYFIVTINENKQELKKPEFIKTIQDVNVKEGQSVKFRCKVKGYPQPRVTWYKDGKLIKSSKSCRLEKFGNRDYIMTIDNATLDDDAEYSVVARNIAGEVKSTGEVLVDSDQLDSMVTTPTNNSFQQRKNDKNLSSLSDKVMSARNDITSTAESMLGTAEELSYLNQNLDVMDKELNSLESKFDEQNNNMSLDERLGDTSGLEAIEDYRAREKAAKNVRMLTSSALKVLRTAEEIIQSERENDNFVTSTPRQDVPEKTDSCNNNIRDDVSSVSTDSFKFVKNKDGKRINTGATSVKPQDIDEKMEQKQFSFGDSESDVSDFIGRKYGLPRDSTLSPSSEYGRDTTMSPTSEYGQTRDSTLSSTSDSLRLDLADVTQDETNDSSTLERVNLGPKSVEKSRFSRDYEVKAEGKKKWEVKLGAFSPQADIVNRQQVVENTEEQIYMTAGKVYTLEDRVRDLESRVTSDKGQMSDLEDEVALTVAQIAQSERQVDSIQQTVNRLQETPEPPFLSPRGDPSLSPRGDLSSQLSSPRLSIDSGVSSIRERPPQTTMIGHTCEDEVPESRSEYDADSGIELPSVNRLRAMFSRPKEEEFGDGSFTRIHSITARHVPKEQLERLRRNEFAMGLNSENDQSELSSKQTSSTTLNFTFSSPQRPASLQTIRGSSPSPASTSASASPKALASAPSGPVTYRDLEPGKEPILIYPEPGSVAPQSSHKKLPTTPKSSSNVSSVGTGSRTRVRSATPVPKRSETESELLVLQAAAPGPSPANEDRPKTPRIRSGAISARAAFWEKRIMHGSTSDEAVAEDFPEMLQESDA